MMEQVLDVESARRDIRAKVVELARHRVKNARISDDEVIPETGLLDSAAIMELIVWFELHFALSIDQGDVTIENFGTVNAMVSYLTRA